MAEQNLINVQILLKFLLLTYFYTLWSAEAPMKLFSPTHVTVLKGNQVLF